MNKKNMQYMCVCMCILSVTLATEEYKDTHQSPALNPGERYQDMFPLTAENFTEKLLRNKDPWIVIFHDGSIEKEWKTMATHLRGLCWFGLVDIKQERSLLDQLEYSNEIARVYPFGERLTKMRKWTSVKTQNEARSLALSSLPDKTQQITGSDVHDLMMDCFMAQPSKFPAYIITDEQETTALFKALSVRFEKYFIFGRVVKPSGDDLKQLGLGELYISPPALFVIVTQDGTLDKVNAVKYDTDRLGAMNYTNVMQFLFAINSQFRHTLPGENQSNQKQEAEMEDIIAIEADRFDVMSPGKNKSSSKESNSDKEHKPSKDIQFKVTSGMGRKDEL